MIWVSKNYFSSKPVMTLKRVTGLNPGIILKGDILKALRNFTPGSFPFFQLKINFQRYILCRFELFVLLN